jgi:hypothetical protein
MPYDYETARIGKPLASLALPILSKDQEKLREIGAPYFIRRIYKADADA